VMAPILLVSGIGSRMQSVDAFPCLTRGGLHARQVI
jgi:hypothetical protein